MNDEQKAQSVELLLSLGSDKTETEIRSLLEHHNWNADAAAGALFDAPNAASSSSAAATGANMTSFDDGWAEHSRATWDGPRIDDDQPTSWAGGTDIERGRSVDRNSRGVLNANSSHLMADTRRYTTPPPRHPSPVTNIDVTELIDLTGVDDTELEKDDDLSKALKLSLEEHQQTSFGPSDRAPSVHWAMVPSNKPVNGAGADADADIDRALSASLQDMYQDDVYEELPPIDQVRKGNRPLALRTAEASQCWGVLLIQALFHIPQVRLRVGNHDFGDLSVEEIDNIPESRYTYLVQQFFALFEFGQMAYYTAPLQGFEFSNATAHVGNVKGIDTLTDDYYEAVATGVERTLFKSRQDEDDADNMNTEETWPRLFHFRQQPLLSGNSSEPPIPGLSDHQDRCLVRVSYYPYESPSSSALAANELLECLTNEHLFGGSGGTSAKGTMIEFDADVVVVSLKQSYLPPPSSAPGGPVNGKDAKDKEKDQDATRERMPFQYPASFYLDRFLAKNKDVVTKIISDRKENGRIVQELEKRKVDLCMHDGQNVIPALKDSLIYLREIAPTIPPPAQTNEKDSMEVDKGETSKAKDKEAEKDGERERMLKEAADNLEVKIREIEAELKRLDQELETHRAHSHGVFDREDLQKCRYDLRAVLYQDGLLGREHVYSYVRQQQQEGGVWWKTVDHVVSEVTEEQALNDHTGLHIGGAPYMLFYSRALGADGYDVPNYPDQVIAEIRSENASFRGRLPEDMAKELEELDRDGDLVAAGDITMQTEPQVRMDVA